jgi:predicted porin
MKKSLMALALLSATAGVAHAQSAVQIYGTVDAGFVKRSGQTLNIGKRAANTLGFKGTEDLGNGLKALFQLEMRYESDTGTFENGNRPLFQGQSRVGLAGDFGMVRIGRGVTAYQESIGAFDPWHGLPTPAGFYTDLSVAGYSSQPLDTGNASNNRWSNAAWYNSPVFMGFQLNATVATKEAPGAGYIGAGPGNVALAAPLYPIVNGVAPEASANPFSVSTTYNNGPVALMLGYERNHVETKAWSIAGSVAATPELKLMATYSRQDQGHTRVVGDETDAWVLGLNYRMGPGTFLAGYGQKSPDDFSKVKQLSLGYEYALSKRTYVYFDASRKKNGLIQNPMGGGAIVPVGTSVNHYDIGVSHSF